MFTKEGYDIFIPDGIETQEAFSRVTHMGIGAHQDDLEIMTYHGVLECFGREDAWYMGVVVADGAGSPRDGMYAECTDAEMQDIRRVEQRKAAFVGEYAACVQLRHSSAEIKDKNDESVVGDIRKLLQVAKPRFIYTHNLADKHDTHVAVALRVIKAIRELPQPDRPEALYGCEVWRGLDWLPDDEKLIFDVSGRDNLAMALVGVYDSQVSGGKRYDLAVTGRRLANATFFASHAVDNSNSVIYAVDMTPLIKDDALDPVEFILAKVNNFHKETSERLRKHYG